MAQAANNRRPMTIRANTSAIGSRQLLTVDEEADLRTRGYIVSPT